MRAILRVCCLVAAAAMLMGTGSCDLDDGNSGAIRWPHPPRATGNPVPPPGKWAAVVWYSPSAYYNPTYISKTCKPGYVPRSSGGRPYCLACSPGTTLVSAGGNFVCAKCPSGYSYYIYQGKPYCKTPS